MDPVNSQQLHHELVDPQNWEHVEAAEEISAWMLAEKDKMLPLTPQQILEHDLPGVITYLNCTDGSRQPVSFNRVSVEYAHSDFVEVGSLITAPEWRGRGIGTLAVKALLGVLASQKPDKTPIALCNNDSFGLYIHLGAKQVEDTSVLPDEVWELCKGCASCPLQQPESFQCCDRPVSLNHIELEAAL